MARKVYQAPQTAVIKTVSANQMLAGSTDAGHGGGNKQWDVPGDPKNAKPMRYTPYKPWDNEGW